MHFKISEKILTQAVMSFMIAPESRLIFQMKLIFLI